MSLSEQLLNPSKKAAVVEDCCTLLNDEVSSKSGVSGLALKAAYSTLKGIKPGYIANALEQLLPACSTALDPIWSEGVQKGNPVEHLMAKRSEAADAILSVTDTKAKNARALVQNTYQKFRGSAKKHVEEAIPGFAKILAKHTSA